MTKKIFTTNINEIRTIKISCQKCGLAIELPISGSLSYLEGCPSCHVKFPVGSVRLLLDAISQVKTTMKGEDYQKASVTFETEFKD